MEVSIPDPGQGGRISAFGCLLEEKRSLAACLQEEQSELDSGLPVFWVETESLLVLHPCLLDIPVLEGCSGSLHVGTSRQFGSADRLNEKKGESQHATQRT